MTSELLISMGSEEGTKRLVLEERVIVPIITPVVPDGLLDKKAIKAICSHVSDAGINTVLVMGRTGGMEYANDAIRLSMTDAVRDCYQGNILLCVGDSTTTFWNNYGSYVGKRNVMHHIDTARWLNTWGIRVGGIVVPALFYGPETHVNVPEDHGTEPYFREVVQAAKKAELPVMLYNNPAMTGREIPLELVAELAADEWVIGIKDSSGDMAYFEGLIDIKFGHEEFMVYQGSERSIADSIAVGADGAVPSLANVFSGLLVNLVGNPTQELQQTVNQLGNAIYCGCKEQGKLIAGLRLALHVIGCYDKLPASRLTPEEKAAITMEVRSFLSSKPPHIHQHDMVPF